MSSRLKNTHSNCRVKTMNGHNRDPLLLLIKKFLNLQSLWTYNPKNKTPEEHLIRIQKKDKAVNI